MISWKSALMLSPGKHMLTSSGSVIVPVTSAVLHSRAQPCVFPIATTKDWCRGVDVGKLEFKSLRTVIV